MKARDIMHRRVITVKPFMTLREVATVFTEHRITGAPVVDVNGKLVGVVSQTDLVRHERESPRGVAEITGYYRGPDVGDMPQGFQLEAPDFTRVSQVMTPAIHSADEKTGVKELARMMLRHHIHRVVITRGGRLSGIVSSLDLLKAITVTRKPARAGARNGK